jgi:hypothetical protein
VTSVRAISVSAADECTTVWGKRHEAVFSIYRSG